MAVLDSILTLLFPSPNTPNFLITFFTDTYLPEILLLPFIKSTPGQ